MACAVAEEVEEMLELCGVSTPCLRSCALLEERMATPGKDAELIADARRLALGQTLRFLVSAIAERWAGTSSAVCLQKLWFDSMHLCDILAARGLDFAHRATSHATAVLRILWKAEDATRTLPSGCLSALTEVLWRHGVAAEPALPEDIDSAERSILHCLGWQIWLPSLHWWLAAFFSRLRVLARERLAAAEEAELAAAMPQLWQHSYAIGAAVVARAASLGPAAPRALAAGLLALGCVRAGLLPLHGIRPERLGAADWEQVCARAVGSATACPAGALAAEVAQILQLATDSSLGAVGEACWLVALAVPDALLLRARLHAAVQPMNN
ncbi:unnamed protein product [Prorocentrum cordatum]|uniref:Uncharacterized protein n=1 Tax=Prorocentrum cordatum TaxID=2364126 RepID=A0ABN9QJ32_9DINO|nr:unnamed protein product [Polarella glacialis]